MADFTFKVNGVEIRTDNQFLLAKKILVLAKEKGAIPGNPDEYILKGDKGEYQVDSRVNLAEDDVLYTIPNKSTPVAHPMLTGPIYQT